MFPQSPTLRHQQYKMTNSSQGAHVRLQNEGCPTHQPPHSQYPITHHPGMVGWVSAACQGVSEASCALKWRDPSFIPLSVGSVSPGRHRAQYESLLVTEGTPRQWAALDRCVWRQGPGHAQPGSSRPLQLCPVRQHPGSLQCGKTIGKGS